MKNKKFNLRLQYREVVGLIKSITWNGGGRGEPLGSPVTLKKSECEVLFIIMQNKSKNLFS